MRSRAAKIMLSGAVLVILLIGLSAYVIIWKVSIPLPPHVDPHLTISDIKTKSDVNGFAGQKIILTIKDNHQYLFPKPLKLLIRITQDHVIYNDINKDVNPGTIEQLLPPLDFGNRGWWASAKVEDADGDKATAPERYIRIGDDDYLSQ